MPRSSALIILTVAIYALHINSSSDQWKRGLWKRVFQLLAAPDAVLTGKENILLKERRSK